MVLKKSSPLFLAAAFAFLGLPVSLFAQTAVMYYVPGLYYQTYSSSSSFSTSFNFSVARQGQGDIDFFVTVDGGLSNSFTPRYATSGTDRIEYYIYDNLTDRNILKAGSTIGTQDVISGGFNDPSSWYETTTASYSIFVPADQFLPLGEYRDTLTFTLYTGTPSNYNPSTAVSLSVPVVLATERYLALRLAAAGGTFASGTQAYTLNFGNLWEGQTKELDMIVSSTIYFDVAFSSANRGKLKQDGGSDLAPYQFRLDDDTVDLSSGWKLDLQNEGPTIGGERAYRIQVEIGDVTGLDAGTYRDSITVSVMAR